MQAIYHLKHISQVFVYEISFYEHKEKPLNETVSSNLCLVVYIKLIAIYF